MDMELGWKDTDREEYKFYEKTQSQWEPKSSLALEYFKILTFKTNI